MKYPGDDTVRMIIATFITLLVIVLIWYAVHTRDKAKKADALTAKVEVLQDSAEISRQANEQAGTIMGKLGRKASKDREIINAARNPTATTSDHDRVQRRAFEAFAEGLCAERGLQRENCGSKPASTTDE